MGEYTEHAPSQASELDGLPDENGSLGEQCCCDDCESLSGDTRIIPDSTTPCPDGLNTSGKVGIRFGSGLFNDGSEEGEAVTFTFPNGSYTLAGDSGSRTHIYISWDKWLLDMWADCKSAPFPIGVAGGGQTYMNVGSCMIYYGDSPVVIAEGSQYAPQLVLLNLRFTWEYRKSGTSTTESYLHVELQNQNSPGGSSYPWYSIFEDTFDIPTCGESVPITGSRVMSEGKSEIVAAPETTVDLDTYANYGEAISKMFSGGMFVIHPCATDSVQDHKVDPFGVYADPTHTDVDYTIEVEVLPDPCYEWFGVAVLKLSNSSSTVSTISKPLRVAGDGLIGPIICDAHAYTFTDYANEGCTGTEYPSSQSFITWVYFTQSGVSVYGFYGNDLGGIVGESFYTSSFDFWTGVNTDLEIKENCTVSFNVGTS